uniref:Golgin-84 n=1 Tax=Globisporangium ultimum (strain ATCC 200006 / CBS 805.95 / DAOM BR144) TaxID=431595 RepID=K3WZ55_GLOUD
MNWVNSSLQLAGNLLESVDQHAAFTLSGPGSEGEEEGEEQEGLLSSLKTRIALATDAVRGDSVTSSEAYDEDVHENGEFSDEQKDAHAANTEDMPPRATTPHVRSTPPSSGSGKDAASRSLTSSSPPRSSSGSNSVEDECNRLRKELTRMKTDLRAKEKTLGATQKSLRIYEEEIEALERECKEKIAEVQQEMVRLRHEKDADERNFVQALELKDAQAQNATNEVEALQEAKRLQTEEIVALRAELAKAVESKDNLWTSAASVNNESEQLILSLRAELQETLTSMNNLKREHENSKQSMFARQSQLERTNTELANNVANLERELAKAKQTAAGSVHLGSSGPGSNSRAVNGFHSGASNGAISTLNEDYRRVQQTLVLTKKTLHDETRKNEVQKQEMLGLHDEIRRLKHALQETHNATAQQIFVVTRENEALKEKLSQLAAGSHTNGTVVAESRIQTLTNRLVEKQETIDGLRSKVTTLEVRLVDAQTQSQNAEDKLAQIERNGGILDMEMATPVGKRQGGGMRSRPNRMANMISRVAPVVERSSRVVTALDVLDRWLLFLGRMFLSYPFARLGLLCYIALIHFWVFVVLSFHTSHLSEEMQQHAAGANGGGGIAAGFAPGNAAADGGKQALFPSP